MRLELLKRHFDQWLLGAAALIAVLVVAAALAYYNTQQLGEDAAWVAHSHEVLDTLSQVQADLRQAEAVQRTYLITGGDAPPEKFRASLAEARKTVGRLKSLTVDNRPHQQRLPEIAQRIESLEAFWTNTMQVRREQGFAAAQAIVREGQSAAMMAGLDKQLQDLSDSERALLADRDKRRAQAYRTAIVSGLLSGIAGVVAVVSFVILLQRHMLSRAAAAQAIAEQAERLRTTLASIGDGVITTDRQGRVTGMNAVAEQLTGWTAAEATGRELDLVFHIINETTRAGVRNPATRALTEEVIVGLANDTLLISKDGRERPIDDSAAPIRCADGEVVGCVLVFRDVGDRRLLERAKDTRLGAARLLAAIVESSHDAIVSKTLDGVIRSWNRGAESVFGFTAEQAIGKHISLIIPPERIVEENEIIARLQSGEVIEYYETERVRSDGRRILVALTISPVHDEEGRIVGASKIARDITSLKETAERERRLLAEAAEANAKFRAFFDQGPLFAGIMDLDGTILEPNRMSWEWCGFTREQIVGKKFWDGPWWTPSPELVATIRQACADAAAGKPFHRELEYYVGDGSKRVADVQIQPIADESGRTLFLAPTGTDITERLQLEDQLRRLASDLSEAGRRKDEFLATLAHELRNPLAAIHGASQLLDLTVPQDTEQSDAAGVIHRQIQHMVRLVDDLMDVSRITRGKLDLRMEQVELASVVEQAIEASRDLVDGSRHRLSVSLPHDPVYLHADPVRLAQILSNLLNNAAKYSDEGSQIWLTATRRDDCVELSVKDTGIGIEPDQMPRLFEMFAQVHTTTNRSRGGVGIGLALVRGLVEMHQGSIEAQSQGAGKGSEFIVRLPLAPHQQPEPPRPALETSRDKPSSQRRILVADDNPDIARTLAMLLKLKGHEVQIARDGEEALRACREFQPQLAMLDIGMPQLNGYEVARKIRRESWGTKVRLAAMTGWGQPEDKQRAMEAGFDHHLTKPVGAAELDQLLGELVDGGG
jgi:PAS domain S-box-containing protein